MFVCIGTEKIMGDSIGPRIGTIIEKSNFFNKNVEIIGTKENPLRVL